MSLSDKQVKLVEGIAYQADPQQLEELVEYMQALSEFRESLQEKKVAVKLK